MGIARLRRFVLTRLAYWYFAFIFLFLLTIVGLVIYEAVSVGRFRLRQMLMALFVLYMLGSSFIEVVRSKIPAPKGWEVSAQRAPALVQMIESVAKQLNAPKVDTILFDASTNAMVAEIPRWGAVGPYRRYLAIGAPLLLFLSADELKAVIAHEMAHLSKAHGKDGFRTERAFRLWERIAEGFRESGREGNRFVWPFLVRYIPALKGEAYAASRENEFAADQDAARIVGPARAASALLKLHLYGSFIEHSFWSKVYGRIRDLEQPPQDVFFQLEAFCSQPLTPENPQEILDGVMAIRSVASSTHPSLAERFAAIGIEPSWPEPAKPNALRVLFGERGDELLREVSSWWAEEASEVWSALRRDLQEATSRLQALDEQAAGGSGLPVDEAVESALLVEKVEGRQEGLNAFRSLQADHPDDIRVLFHTGRLLLMTGDEEGVELLHRAAEQEAQLIPHCGPILYRYFCSQGDIDRAFDYYAGTVRFMMTNDEVREERSSLSLSDELLAHDLSLKEVDKACRILERKGYVERAYFTRKELKVSGDLPLYVVLVKLKSRFPGQRKRMMEDLLNSDLIPWEFYVVPIYRRNRQLEYKAALLPGSRVL